MMKVDKRIQYNKNNKNNGFFYNINKGVLLSKGEYIIILKCDELFVSPFLFETVLDKISEADILFYKSIIKKKDSFFLSKKELYLVENNDKSNVKLYNNKDLI